MHRLVAVIVPVVVAAGASAWLYRWPGARQRLDAPVWRKRVVLNLSVMTGLLATAAFFSRKQWVGDLVPPDVALSIFLGLILLIVSLLYAALPPQQDL